MSKTVGSLMIYSYWFPETHELLPQHKTASCRESLPPLYVIMQKMANDITMVNKIVRNNMCISGLYYSYCAIIKWH